MFCPDCNQTVSSIDIVNNALQSWKDCLIPSNRAQHNRPDTMIPLSKERLDMAAYTFSYHMNEGCLTETNPFWGNSNVRETLLRYRFEEHSISHSASCRVLGFKLKENAQSYKCKNYYGKKVWTVSATDVEWFECEHVNKTSLLLQMKSQINELKHQLDLPVGLS